MYISDTKPGTKNLVSMNCSFFHVSYYLIRERVKLYMPIARRDKNIMMNLTYSDLRGYFPDYVFLTLKSKQ